MHDLWQASHPMIDLDTRQSTDDLWTMLFVFVDLQLELWRQGNLRDAVMVRRRCREVGRAIRSRYEE